MRLLALLFAAWLLRLAWQRRIHPPAWLAPWCYYAHNGIIAAIIAVIVSVVASVAQVVMTVGSFIWNGLNDAITGLSRGITWLWSGVGGIFKSVGGFIQHVFQDVIGNWLSTLYQAYLKLEGWLAQVFGPIIKIFAKVMNIWNTYIQPYVRLALNVIQRIRLALKILTLFHVQWAQKLDQDLANIQQQIIQNDLLIFGYLRLAANILNDLVNPLGLLRNNVLAQSVIAALNDLSLALTGSNWSALGLWQSLISGRGGNTASIKLQMDVGAQQVFNKQGDAGDIFTRGTAVRQSLFNELGLQGSSVL